MAQRPAVIYGLCQISDSLEAVQAHEEGYVRVLPPVGRTVKVAFYSGSCDSLAHSHAVLLSLLRVCSKPRAGTYRSATACTDNHLPW